jgi:hypothetical protein
MSEPSLPNIYVVGYIDFIPPRFISTLTGAEQSSILGALTFDAGPLKEASTNHPVNLIPRKISPDSRVSSVVDQKDGIILVYYPHMLGQPEAVEAELHSLDSQHFSGPIAVFPALHGFILDVVKSTHQNLPKLKCFNLMELTENNAKEVGSIFFVVSIHTEASF